MGVFGSRVRARTANSPAGSARIARARPPPCAPVAPSDRDDLLLGHDRPSLVAPGAVQHGPRATAAPVLVGHAAPRRRLASPLEHVTPVPRRRRGRDDGQLASQLILERKNALQLARLAERLLQHVAVEVVQRPRIDPVRAFARGLCRLVPQPQQVDEVEAVDDGRDAARRRDVAASADARAAAPRCSCAATPCASARMRAASTNGREPYILSSSVCGNSFERCRRRSRGACRAVAGSCSAFSAMKRRNSGRSAAAARSQSAQPLGERGLRRRSAAGRRRWWRSAASCGFGLVDPLAEACAATPRA